MKSLFNKKIVGVACALVITCALFSNPIYAEETTSGNAVTTTVEPTSTPTPTTEVTTTPALTTDSSSTTETTSQTPSTSAPITITPPNSIIQPVNGVYTSSFGVSSVNDIEDMRFASGKLGMDGYDSAQVVTTTSFDIPASESDQWYTFYVKDVNGNMSFVNFYAHCDDVDDVDDSKTTPTPTTAPTTAPTTPTTPTNGSTSGGTTSTTATTPTTTSLVPTPKAVFGNCLDTQTIDANGNCVDKVTELPQTGGFDTLMLFFLFGCGLGLCGVGVLAYAKVKVKK